MTASIKTDDNHCCKIFTTLTASKCCKFHQLDCFKMLKLIFNPEKTLFLNAALATFCFARNTD